MRDGVNPSLTRVSVLLFHDPRAGDEEARHDELATAAESLAGCLRVLPGLLPPGGDHEGFDLYSTMQTHNALALVQASRQRDRAAEVHWYQHIKETCQSCHDKFRFQADSEAHR